MTPDEVIKLGAALPDLWVRAAQTWDRTELNVLADALDDCDRPGEAAGVRYLASNDKKAQRVDQGLTGIQRYWWDGPEYKDVEEDPDEDADARKEYFDADLGATDRYDTSEERYARRMLLPGMAEYLRANKLLYMRLNATGNVDDHPDTVSFQFTDSPAALRAWALAYANVIYMK